MSDYRIAIVTATFNKDVTDRLCSAAIARAAERGIVLHDSDVTWVPGAVEIPIMAQHYAKTGRYDAIIVFGAVIYGETDHYDYVCQHVTYGCQKVSLDNHIPVIFGVLTTRNLEQALARSGGDKGHYGIECVDTAISMIESMQKVTVSQ